MVYGGREKPPAGATITGGGAGLPGEPGGCPAQFHARGFLILVSLFPRARARECPHRQCLQGFRRFFYRRLFLHFPGLILHFPGESYIFRALSTGRRKTIHRSARKY